MKFKSLLLLPAFSVLLHAASVLSLSATSMAQATVSQAPAGTSSKSADVYSNCQQAANAVVTLYAGTEIGAGSIVDTDGTILTALHVVKEAVKRPNTVKIYVKLANGHRYLGRPIASDASHDLALVQMPVQESLSIVPLASGSGLKSGQIQGGEQVCAIGSPSGRAGVLSQGTFTKLLANGDLQSAVRLTYGNSGGPLLDAQGTLVGVNKAIWLSERRQNTGISYATSAQAAQAFMAKHGHATAGTVAQPSNTPAKPPTLSVQAPLPTAAVAIVPVQPFQPTQERLASTTVLGASLDDRSLTVRQVELGSPAALGGLQQGDRVIAINGNPLKGLQQLQLFLSHQPSTVVLTIDRQQHVSTVQVNF